MQAEVPVEVLAFGVLSGATSVRIPRIPRTDGHFTAQTACIGEVIGRHVRDSRHLVVVWLECLSLGFGEAVVFVFVCNPWLGFLVEGFPCRGGALKSWYK